MNKQTKRLKIGRWIYCKYCYKNVLPIINFNEGLIQCSECGYGLSLLEEDIKAQGLWETEVGQRLRDIKKMRMKDYT